MLPTVVHPSFEIQWEQERLHGDLNKYRHSLEPSEKYVLWKLREEKEDELEKVRKQDLIQCADDISISLEDEDNLIDAEPNYYINGRGETMWRAPNSAFYEKFSNDTKWNTPFAHGEDITGKITFGGRRDGTELAQMCFTALVDSILLEYQKEVSSLRFIFPFQNTSLLATQSRRHRRYLMMTTMIWFQCARSHPGLRS